MGAWPGRGLPVLPFSPSGHMARASALRPDLIFAVQEETLTESFPEAMASGPGDTAGEHTAPWSISSQLSRGLRCS